MNKNSRNLLVEKIISIFSISSPFKKFKKEKSKKVMKKEGQVEQGTSKKEEERVDSANNFNDILREHARSKFETFIQSVVSSKKNSDEKIKVWEGFNTYIKNEKDVSNELGMLRFFEEICSSDLIARESGKTNETNEGSLLLSVSSICLEKEIIAGIIELYERIHEKKPVDFIKQYTDEYKRNVLHYLAFSITHKVARNEEVKEEDFEAYLYIIDIDVNLSYQEDENGDTPIDIIKQQTSNLEKYIRNIEDKEEELTNYSQRETLRIV